MQNIKDIVRRSRIDGSRDLNNIISFIESHRLQIFDNFRTGVKPVLKPFKNVTFYDYEDKPGKCEIKHDMEFRCPRCNRKVGDYFETSCHANKNYRYCPNCGAKLDWSDWTFEKEEAMRIERSYREHTINNKPKEYAKK